MQFSQITHHVDCSRGSQSMSDSLPEWQLSAELHDSKCERDMKGQFFLQKSTFQKEMKINQRVSFFRRLESRAAIFILVQHTKSEKNIPNGHKMFIYVA
jgi:hypothetical protein